MENMEYANAYTEVIEILKYISEADYNKIPKNKINLFETNANKEYKFTYNPNLTLNEQNVSKRAKAIIAILFREYWATEKQREKIIAKQNNVGKIALKVVSENIPAVRLYNSLGYSKICTHIDEREIDGRKVNVDYMEKVL